MRILVFSDVPPHVVGGAEMQIWRLARAWATMGHQVEIAGHRIPAMKQEGIRLVHLSVLYPWGRALRGMSYFLSLAGFLLWHRKHYDLIYCRFLGEAAISVAMLKNLGLVKQPLVAVPAAGGREDKADVALIQSLPGTEKIIVILSRQCDCVNFIAPCIEESLSQVGLRPKMTAHIPNGVPVSEDRTVGAVSGIKRLLFVGRLVYQKGLDILLPILARLSESGSQFELRLVGDGPDRQYLENLTRKLGLQDCVSFLGEQPQSIVREELMKAYLFVLPSRYEGMSNAALEALSCGLPCVLTRCGGIDAYLSPDVSWVCGLEDPDDLYRALMEALNVRQEKWKEMSDSCRYLVMNNFSLESVARRNIELFETLIRVNPTY
ncbi:MAG: glycosyltransferase family 4 protein [Candidatus Methylumidiphilus sp.]